MSAAVPQKYNDSQNYLDLCHLASQRIYFRGGKIAPAGNLQIPRDIFLPTSARSYICGSTRAVKCVVKQRNVWRVPYQNFGLCNGQCVTCIVQCVNGAVYNIHCTGRYCWWWYTVYCVLYKPTLGQYNPVACTSLSPCCTQALGLSLL